MTFFELSQYVNGVVFGLVFLFLIVQSVVVIASYLVNQKVDNKIRDMIQKYGHIYNSICGGTVNVRLGEKPDVVEMFLVSTVLINIIISCLFCLLTAAGYFTWIIFAVILGLLFLMKFTKNTLEKIGENS